MFNPFSEQSLAHYDVSLSFQWDTVLSTLEKAFGKPILDVLDFSAKPLGSGGAWGVVPSRREHHIRPYGRIWKHNPRDSASETYEEFPLVAVDVLHTERMPAIQWSSVQLIYPGQSVVVELIYYSSHWQPVISFFSPTALVTFQSAISVCPRLDPTGSNTHVHALIPSSSPLALAARAIGLRCPSQLSTSPDMTSRISAALPNAILHAIKSCTTERRLAVEGIDEQNNLISDIVSKFQLNLNTSFRSMDYPDTHTRYGIY